MYNKEKRSYFLFCDNLLDLMFTYVAVFFIHHTEVSY